jgi:L-lactate dehydrogenase complex protein LldF
MDVSGTDVLEQFIAEATRAGSIVYQATSPEEVSSYIINMAREHNMNHIVKSKSLLANRIGLRPSLQSQGFDVKETDIAEWITQISGKKLAQGKKPLVHKNIERIAEVISKETATECNDNPKNIMALIRMTLREFYINADIGISEAEIAVAETGTYIMASDEGNDRLVSLLPKLHVTLIEQRNLVADWDTALIMLKELYKDEQGYRMPSFITYVTGRNTTGDIPGALMARAQGPEEEHIIVVNIA